MAKVIVSRSDIESTLVAQVLAAVTTESDRLARGDLHAGDLTVTIAGYSSDGTHHIPLGPFVLNPHTADGTFFTPDTGFGYCAFALSSGADSVRAHAQLYDETETTSVFQGSSEAR